MPYAKRLPARADPEKERLEAIRILDRLSLFLRQETDPKTGTEYEMDRKQIISYLDTLTRTIPKFGMGDGNAFQELGFAERLVGYRASDTSRTGD